MRDGLGCAERLACKRSAAVEQPVPDAGRCAQCAFAHGALCLRMLETWPSPREIGHSCSGVMPAS